MILTIDIGNTNIVVGCIDDEKTYFIERLSTVKTKTELEYAVDIKTVLEIYKIDRKRIRGGIISSVVPQITNIMREAAEKIIRRPVKVVGPGLKTGLNILMDNPAQLGSDLVADAVAGLEEYPVPLIIFDMGTATTVSVIDSRKCYIGGMILPGVMVSLNALAANAAQLQGIGLELPRKTIGKNAACIDGLILRIEEELGQKCTVVATGGLAKSIVPHCKRKVILDDDLLLKGLLAIYEKNQQEKG